MDYQELSREDTRAEARAAIIACSILFASVSTHLQTWQKYMCFLLILLILLSCPGYRERVSMAAIVQVT